MANYCSIEGTIILKTIEQAKKISQAIESALYDGKNSSLDFGGNVWLLDVNLNCHENVVHFSCEVKWCLDQDDMIKFVLWLAKIVPLPDMNLLLRYEEMGCQIIGRYELQNCVLTDFYIPEYEFPQYPEIKDGDNEDKIYDAYMNQLYTLLESAEGETIHDFS